VSSESFSEKSGGGLLDLSAWKRGSRNGELGMEAPVACDTEGSGSSSITAWTCAAMGKHVNERARWVKNQTNSQVRGEEEDSVAWTLTRLATAGLSGWTLDAPASVISSSAARTVSVRTCETMGKGGKCRHGLGDSIPFERSIAQTCYTDSHRHIQDRCRSVFASIDMDTQ
jgi:hypothetical protein